MSFPPRRIPAILALLIVVATVSAFAASVLRASVSDTESVCISLRVIGLDNGDPGSGGCGAVVVSSSSSSSFSFSSAVTSSTSSQLEAQVDSGGRQYSIPRSRWKIVRLLEQWTRRNTLHAAASQSSSSSASSRLGMWYDDAVRLLQERGYIDHPSDLRLNADATRAEVAKIITVFSGSTLPVPAAPSFDDAIVRSWYEPFIERAALRSWMLGYNNCFGTRPCYFRPAAVITRAEAAAVLVRVFGLHERSATPAFTDVPSYAWYREPVQAAADACILQGKNGFVRPDDHLTRAELFVMFARALSRQTYGTGCHADLGQSTHVASSSSSVSLTAAPLADDICTGSVPMCVIDALRSDAVTFFSDPFGASLLIQNTGAALSVPASEWVMWILLIIIAISGISLVSWVCRPRGLKQR